MRSLSILILSLLCTTSYAQKFKGEASIPAVERDGFYRVFLSPSLSTHLNRDLSNLRIYDQQNKEVPYLLQQESPVRYTQAFKEYEIVEKKLEKNCCTTLILRNPEGNSINNISLSIKNAEVTKHATLLGSDDKKNWFALKQSFTVTNLDNKDQTSEIRIVDFPLSNYTYYSLQIEDSTSAPLNILRAGYYEVNSEDGKYTEIKTRAVAKSDSVVEKKSFVQITFDTTQIVDKLSVTMTGPTYFLRRASLSIKKEKLNKKGVVEYYYEWLYDFELSSKQSSVIDLPEIHTAEFLITIENNDNPSLDAASIKAYQLNRYLTAYLKKGVSHTLKLGEPELQAATYDLGFFKDSIPNQPPLLAMGALSIFKEERAESTTFFTSRSIIWIAIGLVIIVLGFMSLKLVREAGNPQKK